MFAPNLRRMSTREQLLAEIEAFLTRHNMAASTFGRMAIKSHKLVYRLREGKDITTSSADAVRAFMASYAPDRASRRSEATCIA